MTTLRLPTADAVSVSDTVYQLHEPNQLNTVTMIAGGEEMIRVSPDGFYIRGKKVPQDDQEALAVYQAFKEFLVWSNLTR